jgi:UDP-glucuronate decarboxylase
MLDLAQKVIELTESKSLIEYLPLPSDDPKQRCPDINLAHEKLNWSPRIELEEGLLKTITDFRLRLEK